MSYIKTKYRTVYFMTESELNTTVLNSLFKGFFKPRKKRRYKTLTLNP